MDIFKSNSRNILNNSYNREFVHKSNIPEIDANGLATLSILATCNYYAMIIGYITILVLLYLFVSWIMSFFSDDKKDEHIDENNDIDEDYCDDEM